MEVAVIGVAEVLPAAASVKAVPMMVGGKRGRRTRSTCRFSRKFLGGGEVTGGGRRLGGGGVPAPAVVAVVKAATAESVIGEKKAVRSRKSPAVRRPQLFVGLPLDTICNGTTVNHAKAVAAGLKALKLLGADGVEVPLWWGIVEKEGMGKYDWTGYLALVQMIRDAGLKIRASLYFHASKFPAIPLPSWVSKVGDSQPDIYFADKEGKRSKECLSLAADDLPVFDGKSPIQVYEAFCRSFQDTFAEYIGSTITEVSIGLGPGGELRYPSTPQVKSEKPSGVGEFQCYDKNMLRNLKDHAEGSGNPLWGLSGPHDAPRFDQTPRDGHFFKEHGGSWDTPYGNFFLTWYSRQLLSHGDRILSMASSVFGASHVTISAKIPLMHSWYKTRSHASELTAGFYNTDGRDGYNAVAEMFARNSCRMVVTGVDLLDENQPQTSQASPETLVSQIKSACKRHGVYMAGENSAISGGAEAFDKIKSNILGRKSLVKSFTYQRMGASFFSPDHWPRFTEFVRSLDRPELHADDLASEDEGTISLRTDVVTTGSSRQMQAV